MKLLYELGRIQEEVILPWPGGSVGGALTCTPKGRGSNLQLGHVPGLWVPSLVGVPTGGNQRIFLCYVDVSCSLSFPVSLRSLKKKKKR